jgi:ribosomal protein S18 acetylase RimI-like enzyme
MTDGHGIMVHEIGSADDEWVVEALTHAWGSVMVARRGALLDASAYPGFIALVDGRRVGLAIVVVDGDQCEVLSLDSQLQRAGVGRALMQHCFAYARAQGCRRVWLITTNDNVTAIAFYQRIGMDLCALHRRAVEQARMLKPTIPTHDDHGVAIAHELEFELLLE